MQFIRNTLDSRSHLHRVRVYLSIAKAQLNAADLTDSLLACLGYSTRNSRLPQSATILLLFYYSWTSLVLLLVGYLLVLVSSRVTYYN